MATDITISHYSAGTATVAANGTAVTGQGTAWADAIRTGDLFGTHRGLPIRILSINSNTSLTLAHPWPGPAQTAAAYEIQHTPRDMGYRRAIEELISDVSEGNLPLLAALLGAPNKLAYFDSSHSMALADLTAFARTLLGDANAAAVRSRLALGDASFVQFATLLLRDVQSVGLRSIRAGSATNRSIEVGAESGSVFFGYGASGRFAVKDDPNLMAAPWFEVSATEGRIGGRAIYSRGNVLGTVSQSGGVPSGAIVERGGNANGIYIRCVGGLQVCYLDPVTFEYGSPNRAEFAWTFPAPFSGTKYNAFVTGPITPENFEGSLDLNSVGRLTASSKGPSGARFNVISTTGDWANGRVLNQSLTAIGVWHD